MMYKAFSNLLKYIDKLPHTKKEQVYQWGKRYVDPTSSVGGRLINEMRETRFKDGFECPHCTSEHIVRFGKYKGRQRYKCKACCKTFSDMTNTVLYRTRKGNEWIAFVECMFKGYSLRKSAEIVGVTWVTLFYWRHKLLSALKKMDFDQFEGIVEADETYFLYSEKGKRGITGRKPRKRGGKSKYRGISKEQVCVLVARDRMKSTVAKVTKAARELANPFVAGSNRSLSREDGFFGAAPAGPLHEEPGDRQQLGGDDEDRPDDVRSIGLPHRRRRKQDARAWRELRSRRCPTASAAGNRTSARAVRPRPGCPAASCPSRISSAICPTRVPVSRVPRTTPPTMPVPILRSTVP